MAGVELKGIVKRYGAAEVIHGVSLDIADGEFVIFVGPSGCGKSTTLRMIAGLEDISEGEILIDGKVVNDVAPKQRDIAMVFQNYALYPHMTVAENMGFSLKLSGVPKAEREERVRRAADILDLTALLDRQPKQLSGGQRQRVAMGRTIVRDPKVFLFDEPLSNLDAKLRVAMRGEIKSLHHQLKSTVVYVTHDQIEAMTMADRIVVMNEGCVEQIGTPLDLYDRPANQFVAAFIGSPSMNFFAAELVEGDDGLQVQLADGPSWPVRVSGKAGDKVILGIRPEHFVLADADDNALGAVVHVVEPTGSETHVSLRWKGQVFEALFRERIGSAPGEVLNLQADPEHLHVFEVSSGKRLD